jgi:hypothetical protein
MPEVEAAIERSTVASGVVRVNLGGTIWEVRSHTPELPMEIDVRTREFLCAEGDEADALVDVFWAESFPDPGPVLFDAGLWRAHTAGDGIQFDFFTERLGSVPYKRAIFDSDFNHGRVLLSRRLLSEVKTYYPLEYPLDELASMHRLGRGYGVELHSCGLAVTDETGYLFVGHSGAGKSTLGSGWVKCRAATILSDDRMIVTRDSQGYRMHGTPWHGEAGLAKNLNACLKAIFLIQHGSENKTVKLPKHGAAAELLSRSFVPWYRAEDLDFTLKFLEEMIEVTPVYVFHCLPNVSAIEYLEAHHAI